MARRASRIRSQRVDTRSEDEQQASRQKLFTYGAPWGVTVGGCLAAETAHVLLSTTPASLALAALGLAGTGAGLSRLLWHMDTKAKRDKETRIRHQVNAIATTAGLTLGTVAGVDTGATMGTWLLAGSGLSLANNLWSAFNKKAGGEKSDGKWAKLEAEIGLAKHELKEAKSNGKGTVIVDIEATDGATAEELARRIPSLTSALKLGRGRITQTVDDDDDSKITMRVQVADLLKEGTTWPGPSAFGAGFGALPIAIGRYEDGETLKLNLPGVLTDPQEVEGGGNVEHCIAQGTNGAGKTVGNALICTEAATRTEVSIIIINCSKFMQDYGHVRHAADMVITNEKDARRFFKQLHTVIKERGDYLASKGLAKWEAGCGLNFLLIIGEEAADFADGDEYAKVLRTLRSTGGWFLSSIQRATHDQINTTARSNHPAGMAYGLADGSEAQYILPPEAIEAGAYPGWANRKPGYLYAAGMGIDQERWAVVARTYGADRPTLAAAVTAGMNVRTPMDPTTANAFGALWTNRTFYTTPLLKGGEDGTGGFPQQAAASPAPAQPDSENDDNEYVDSEDEEDEDMDIEVDPDLLAKETEELDDALRRILAEDPEPGAYDHLDAEQEIEAPADEAPVFQLPGLVPDEDRMSPEDTTAAIFARLDKWLREGKDSFEPKELNDLWMRVDKKGARDWWNRLKKQLLDDGVIAKDESEDGYGSYDLIRSPLENGDGE
ncbi:FtsK/SpoIIIE domain-containing protein [Streptomyces virginiae]